MAIKIKLNNRVGVTVKGTLTDESGKIVPFDFLLVCDRVDDEGNAIVFPKDSLIVDNFVHITRDWKRVQGEDGQDLPYSEEGLRELFKVRGLPQLAELAYYEATTVKAKN